MCLRMSNRDRSHSQIYLGFFFFSKTPWRHLVLTWNDHAMHRIWNQQTSKILSILWSRHSTQYQGKISLPRANYKPLTLSAAIYLHSVLLYSPAFSYLSFLQLFQWKIRSFGGKIVFIILTISKAWSQNCSAAEA